MFRILSVLFVQPVLAQEKPPEINAATIQHLMTSITDKLLPIGAFLAFGFIVYGGYMWMISAGDPEKVKRAQGVLTWAIIGLVFTILVEVILSAVLKAVQ